MTNEATELRCRAENLHLFAGSYDLHAANPMNSPIASAAYEKASAALSDAYLALTAAADLLDEQLPLPFSLRDVRAVEVRAIVAPGIDRKMVEHF